MTDEEKIKLIKYVINNKSKNYGGYIENALDIDETLIDKITNILNDIKDEEGEE
jgi:hypothetical protein